MLDSQEMDLVYKYSSEDDSDEENHTVPVAKNEKRAQIRSPKLENATGMFIQKRGSAKGSTSYRGTTPMRNSSVTPPPCVLRKFRREQNGSINNSGNSNANPCLKSKNANNSKELDQSRASSPSPSFLPDGDHQNGKPLRTPSDSSLSTLTADTYVSNNVTLMGHYGKQNSFSSLQRPTRNKPVSNESGAGVSYNKNSGGHRPVSSSANASPLLGVGNNSCWQNGHYHRSNTGSGGSNSPYGAHSPNNTFDRNGATAKAFHLERTMHNVTKDLENVSQDAKQLEIELSGVKQDIGNTQDNVATLRGYVDTTKERVTKLQTQVGSIEKQIASILKEAQTMKDQAKKFLEMAESSKVTHDNLMEEAEQLVNFLRQSSSYMSPQPQFQHQHGHSRGQFPPSCCTGNLNGSNSGSNSANPYYSTVNFRRKAKTPERTLDLDPEMELLDESQTQMENIIAKHRKSKALLSGSSSSGSGGSGNHNGHGIASHRNSMIEIGDTGNSNIPARILNNNNRSPKTDSRVSVLLK